MKHVRYVVALLCILWEITACQPYHSDLLSVETVDTNISGALSGSTLTPVDRTDVPTSTPKKTILPLVPPKTLADSTTTTPTFDLVSQSLCSPLQYETVASLSEIVTDPYNPPLSGRDERHHGVDFSYYHRGDRDTIEGVGIHAIMAGSVAAVIYDRLPYGNMVIIETPGSMLPEEFASTFSVSVGESLYHLYAHLQSVPLVRVGEAVECGQALGVVGTTGYNIVNPHLHLETRIGIEEASFSGMAFYTTDATPEEMENYQRWRTSGEFRHFDPMSLFSWYLQP